MLVRFTNRPVPEVCQVVDAAGDISLPVIGKLRVSGMTVSQVERRVEAAYVPNWPPEPQVSVTRVP